MLDRPAIFITASSKQIFFCSFFLFCTNLFKQYSIFKVHFLFSVKRQKSNLWTFPLAHARLWLFMRMKKKFPFFSNLKTLKSKRVSSYAKLTPSLLVNERRPCENFRCHPPSKSLAEDFRISQLVSTALFCSLNSASS